MCYVGGFLYLVARLARQCMKERGIIYICVKSCRSIYLVAHLAPAAVPR